MMHCLPRMRGGLTLSRPASPPSIWAGGGRSIAFLPGEAKGVQIPDTDIELCMTEQEMLASFWRVHAGVNKVQKELNATFNGRKFAVPFLYVRSSCMESHRQP